MHKASTDLVSQFNNVRNSMAEQLAGHEPLIEKLIVAIITGGHVLIEGSPGLAKTRSVNRFAKLLDASFVRIQATPDLLPADITGTNVYNQRTGTFDFAKGPLFQQIVLVDEINRAPPKVQSALLEAMGEKQISAAGITHPLADPFMVAATQNPIEHEGTYPLPEAQLDRFMFFVHVAMPDPEMEKKILHLVLNESRTQAVTQPAYLTPNDISEARSKALDVHISDAVSDYIVRLVTATRGYGSASEHAESIEHAASPRGSIYLALASQATAWLAGRDHVIPQDVSALAGDVLSGRIVLKYQAQAEGITGRQIIEAIVKSTTIV